MNQDKQQDYEQEIFERIYDNPINEDGSEKPNRLLGRFKVLEGSMNNYSYEVYAEGEDGNIYRITGREISYKDGGTKNFVTKLSETPDVEAYLKFGGVTKACMDMLDILKDKIDGIGFVKEKSEITQQYQMTFLDGYNQAIEDVVEVIGQFKANLARKDKTR